MPADFPTRSLPSDRDGTADRAIDNVRLVTNQVSEQAQPVKRFCLRNAS